MSRLAKNPVPIPSGVTASVEGQTLTAKGKVERKLVVHKDIAVEIKDGAVCLSIRATDATQQMKAQWGTDHALTRSLLKGVSEGFKKDLELVGVGYRAAVEGKQLVMSLGYSHPVKFNIPEGITITVEKTTLVTVAGNDAQRVGQVCAEIIKWRPPEPYKGKGIKYVGQRILRKEGKKK